MDTAKFLFVLCIMLYVKGEESNNYDPEKLLAKIFNANITLSPRQSGYSLIRFEGQNSLEDQEHQNNGRVTFEQNPESVEAPARPIKFEDDTQTGQESVGYGLAHFQDDNRVNSVNHQDPNRKKKRRRRRKPKQQFQRYPPEILGAPGVQGQLGPDPQNFAQGQNPYLNPDYPTPSYHRPHRPGVSVTSQAVSYVTEALTSVARYDDYQCVPRMLCEAAEGTRSGTPSWLENVSGIQPLLTLLSAYSGISSSPLFVFGRAVFLGMTSKANPGTCRYAYPLCPTDPEKLVHYLNNHNGGFFRFFSAPQDQYLEQLYNQISATQNPGFNQNPGQGDQQNYGLHQNQPGQYEFGQQNYGLHQNQPEQHGFGQQNYGFYQNQPGQHGFGQHNYEFPNQPNRLENYGLQKPSLYGSAYGYQHNYGFSYPYNDNGGDKIRFKHNEDNKIEKRIQNKPGTVFVDNDKENTIQNTKWSFPEDRNNENVVDSNRAGKILAFPEDKFKDKTQTFNNKQIISNFFPGAQSNRQYMEYYNYPPLIPIFDNNNLHFDNRYIKDESLSTESGTNNNYYANNVYSGTYNSNDEDVRIVYVVRGNGDPNNPEIVKLRPGETLH